MVSRPPAMFSRIAFSLGREIRVSGSTGSKSGGAQLTMKSGGVGRAFGSGFDSFFPTPHGLKSSRFGGFNKDARAVQGKPDICRASPDVSNTLNVLI